MPVEPIGLIIGLIGLFTTCIDLIDAISRFKARDKDYEYLVCRLETERVLLWKWGEAVGLCPNPDGTLDQQGYSTFLEDKNTFSAVNQTLACLAGRFQTTYDLVKKYGPRHKPTEQVTYTCPGYNPCANLGQERVPERALSRTSFTMKVSWTFHDREKFSGLVDQIAELSKDLHRLVPTDGPVAAEVGRTLSEILGGIDFGRLVFNLFRELGPSFILGTVDSRYLGPIEHDTGRISRVPDGQQQIAAGSAADRHSDRELLPVEESTRVNNPLSHREPIPGVTSAGVNISDSMLVTTRANSPTERIQSSNAPKQQPRQDWVYIMPCILFFYVIISLMVMIPLITSFMKELLPKMIGLVRS